MILLERGSMSISMFSLLRAKKLSFCIRMKDNWRLEVNTFNKGEKADSRGIYPSKERSKTSAVD